jgi:hypothetical protein
MATKRPHHKGKLTLGSRSNYAHRCIVLLIDDGRHGVVRIASHEGDIAMKMIISALIALSVLAGIAAPASALDTKTFWEQQDRQAH